MRIFDKDKTKELTKEECDFNKGFFEEETIVAGGEEEIVLVYTLYDQKQLYIKEKADIEYWFATVYRELFEKCTRRILLGKTLRDGSDPSTKLQELYIEAEVNANRIDELEKLIKLLPSS